MSKDMIDFFNEIEVQLKEADEMVADAQAYLKELENERYDDYEF